MPKTYSEHERSYLRERLMDEAEDCLARYGVRKTTVDELVRRVNIPKGTFYLFYASKELLFFDVMRRIHDRIHDELMLRIEKLEQPADESAVTQLIYDLYTSLSGTFLFRFAAEGEFELFMRKLPPETVRAHA